MSPTLTVGRMSHVVKTFIKVEIKPHRESTVTYGQARPKRERLYDPLPREVVNIWNTDISTTWS